VERALVLASGPILQPEDFPIDGPGIPAPEEERTMEDGLEAQVARLERTLIVAALERNGGNQSAAARELRLSERAIRYKMRKHGLGGS